MVLGEFDGKIDEGEYVFASYLKQKVRKNGA